jgi:hypothetical protein
MFTLFILGQTVYSLGIQGSTTGSWDYKMVVVNAKNLPPLQMALNGFMLLRLFGMSPF